MNQVIFDPFDPVRMDNPYTTGYRLRTSPKWMATLLGVGGAGGATYFPGTLANIDNLRGIL